MATPKPRATLSQPAPLALEPLRLAAAMEPHPKRTSMAVPMHSASTRIHKLYSIISLPREHSSCLFMSGDRSVPAVAP